MVQRGDIILVPFPFTDLSSEKLRPAVVISSNRLKGPDVCVAFITSRVRDSFPPDAILVSPAERGFSQTGLKVASAILASKIATLDRKIILGLLGRLPKSFIMELNDKLKYALGLS